MASLQWGQSWDGSALDWAETWGEGLAEGEFQLDASTLALAGSLAVSGDFTASGRRWEFEPPLSVAPMTGALTVAGDIAFQTAQSLELVADPLALTGSLSIAGDFKAGNPFALSADGLSLAGSLGIAGDFQHSNRPRTRGGFRYYAEVGGKRIHGTLEEIRRLVLQIAEQDAEETVEQAIPPKPAAVTVKAGRAVKRAMAKAAPEVVRQEVEQARESMQDAYQVAFRAAVSELAARRIEQDEEEAMLLLL